MSEQAGLFDEIEAFLRKAAPAGPEPVVTSRVKAVLPPEAAPCICAGPLPPGQHSFDCASNRVALWKARGAIGRRSTVQTEEPPSGPDGNPRAA